jgi:membrane protease YdiL (CAAX protease family)
VRKISALFEVLGVCLAAGVLEDRLAELLGHLHLASVESPFSLLTPSATNADLLAATHRVLLIWALQYGSYFLLIIPLNWWYRRRGASAYGVTRAGHSWRWLFCAGLGAAFLSESPALIHSLVDAIYPLGATIPWRQGFFDMPWSRWQFWILAAVFSFAAVPVLEELLFRGYFQRRLAEDWGDGPAIIGTSCLFVFAHRQYLILNVYNVTMVGSLFCMAVGLGVVFAYTRSLIPSMLAHAIINVPMTPRWQAALLVVFLVGLVIAFREGHRVVKKVFQGAQSHSCILLGLVCALYVIASQRIPAFSLIALVLLTIAVVLEHREKRRIA